jgi:hypothetical protein
MDVILLICYMKYWHSSDISNTDTESSRALISGNLQYKSSPGNPQVLSFCRVLVYYEFCKVDVFMHADKNSAWTTLWHYPHLLVWVRESGKEKEQSTLLSIPFGVSTFLMSKI